METTTRSFLRNFASFKAKAYSGQSIRIVDRSGTFLFVLSNKKTSNLIGAAKGLMEVDGGIDAPTLPADAWKADL